MKTIISIVYFLMIIVIGFACSTKSVIVDQYPNQRKLSAEEQKITQTIETYFEGWMTGDTTKLGRAMHRTCQLKNIKNNDVIIFDRATYLGFFKPRPRRKNAGGEIVTINITDDIASAKCEIHTEDRLYTDYFNMMKVKDQWYIVDKIATNKLK